MDIEQVRNYCIKKPGVSEEFPFDQSTLVFKVMGKMFCLLDLNPPHFINLKCDPEKALQLREEFNYIKPCYHMNKTHWNTIELEKVIKQSLVKEWIDDSYNLVVQKLPKKIKDKLQPN